MQGVIRTFDPGTGEGVVVRDTDKAEIVLAADALEGSIFRMLRQGQRVNFELDGQERATRIRIGSEPDMGLLPDVQI
jgi:CspA family cold shock protein